MKRTIKFFVIIACIMLFVSPVHARLRIGAFSGFSTGGDVETSRAVFGSRIEIPLQQGFGLELSTSTFSDKYTNDGITIKQDLSSLSLSVLYRTPTRIQGILGAGVSWNVPRVTATIDPAYGASATIDADNAFGMCLSGGLSVPLADHWELFGLYTYSFLEIEGDLRVYTSGGTSSERIKGDYDHGLLKAGFNYLF